MTTALLTDHYELTMLEGALRSGVGHHRAVFEVFSRHLPEGRRYGVVAGGERLLEAVAAFRFGGAEIDFLRGLGVLSPETLQWLADFRFHGDIWGFAEGELYFPGSPVLTVDATFGEGIVLETIVLSVLNHDSAVASAAARMVCAAGGRPLIEMGGRRTHEAAAVAAARAAWIAGFEATSNLEAGRRYRLPTTGTAAHAFTLAHADERAAFEAQVEALGTGTTLLIDTYDVEQGLRAAVEVCRQRGSDGPGAVRIDSGDLVVESRRVRELLDSFGAGETRIVASGDLDEYAITVLAAAPIDAYGVGTRVVTGSGAPTAELVYKLVAIADEPGGPLRSVAKRSAAKVSLGGRKWAYRTLDDAGRITGEWLVIGDARPVDLPGRPLQVPLVVGGSIVEGTSTEAARRHHRTTMAELPPTAVSVEPGPPLLTVRSQEEDVS